MHTDVISVDTTASVTEKVDIMLEHKVGALMVVDTDESLAGVISDVDVLEAVQDGLS